MRSSNLRCLVLSKAIECLSCASAAQHVGRGPKERMPRVRECVLIDAESRKPLLDAVEVRIVWLDACGCPFEGKRREENQMAVLHEESRIADEMKKSSSGEKGRSCARCDCRKRLNLGEEGGRDR